MLLKDYKPKSMLQVASHRVDSARFPVIDVHQHTNDAIGLYGEQIARDQLVAMMDACNVQKMVVLTGLWGEPLQKVIDHLVKRDPDRFMVFTQIDWSKIDDPGFSKLMVEQIREAVARGARGLKVLKDLGLMVRYKSGQLVKADDRKLDQVWDECGRLGIPVAIHTGDPAAFFYPADASNERYEELVLNPDWSFAGHEFPSHRSLLESLGRVLGDHPDTRFIGLHMLWPENLDYVSEQLDRYPNLVVEFGARQAELGRQPHRAHQFFSKYQDRILFGSDHPASETMYRSYFRWLETTDEYFEYFGYPRQGRWKIYGLGLPADLLEKTYYLNAERVFKEFEG